MEFNFASKATNGGARILIEIEMQRQGKSVPCHSTHSGLRNLFSFQNPSIRFPLPFDNTNEQNPVTNS